MFNSEMREVERPQKTMAGHKNHYLLQVRRKEDLTLKVQVARGEVVAKIF
jgi:hypothetical protein